MALCQYFLTDTRPRRPSYSDVGGGRLVELKPSILQAFDRFLADAMSAHDMLYKLARERMANE